MKLISLKFWIAHKPLKCEWKCLISSRWSGNIIHSTLYKKIINQKAREIWLFGNDFLSVFKSFRTMWTGGYRWREYVINQLQLLSSSCWSRFSRSELSIGSVFAKEELKRFTCFEFWISHATALSARYRSNIAELDFRFRHRYATVHIRRVTWC